jgi:catechol 2,3-dioxygenase-like lactoylglutathione lyase family enzyme
VIDHFNLPVLDLERSRDFYLQVLAPLGLRLLAVDGQAIGFGRDTWTFGIVLNRPPIPALHAAFHAPSHTAVDAFYQAALAAGAASNGPPGLRPQYDPQYYAAFVLDPDGHNIEAVHRGGVQVAPVS